MSIGFLVVLTMAVITGIWVGVFVIIMTVPCLIGFIIGGPAGAKVALKPATHLALHIIVPFMWRYSKKTWEKQVREVKESWSLCVEVAVLLRTAAIFLTNKVRRN